MKSYSYGNPTCYGTNDGFVLPNLYGGVEPIVFDQPHSDCYANDAGAFKRFGCLTAGSYNLKITDDDGCQVLYISSSFYVI